MSQAMKVLVTDDEAAIRRLIRGALERGGYAVVEAGDARATLAALDIDKPDAVLLDLGLPDRDGMELVPLIKARKAALLIVSAREATAEKIAALDLGADDYVTKPFDTDELLARLRAALRGRLALEGGEPVVTIGDVTIDRTNRRVLRAGAEVHLSPKEYGFLIELARHPGRVITHAALLRAVWGPAHDQDVEYLRVAARGVRQKIDAPAPAPSLIVNDPGIGYRLRDLPG